MIDCGVIGIECRIDSFLNDESLYRSFDPMRIDGIPPLFPLVSLESIFASNCGRVLSRSVRSDSFETSLKYY